MSRVEELTLALVDGFISEAEHDELIRIVAADPAGRRIHLELLRVESVLLGSRRSVGVAASVKSAIDGTDRAPLGRSRRRRISRARTAAALAVAAAVGIALGAVAARRRAAMSRVMLKQEDGRMSSPASRGPAVAIRGDARLPASSENDLRRDPSAALRADIPLGPTLFFDFETGVAPSLLTIGQVVSGPPRSQSHYCVVGEVLPGYPRLYAVSLAAYPDTLAAWTETSLLGFDYWVGDDTDEIEIQINVRDKSNFDFVLGEVTHDSWTHAEIRLADFLANQSDGPALERGDQIRGLLVKAGRGLARLGKPVYIDNVAIADSGPGTVPASTGANRFRPGPPRATR